MIIYKHVFKQKNVFPTLSVSAIVHFLFFFYWHNKDQKKQVITIRKYHNHTLQTKTRPDIIMHFIKQRNQFHFERRLCVYKCVSVSVPFVPNSVVEHVSGFVVCYVQVESAILLMGDVAYDARLSLCNKRNTLRYSHRT